MKFIKKPIIITAVSALAVSGAFFLPSTYAAQATKSIQAVYNNIKIVYNGNEVSTDASTEPFMINGTTYVPLRVAGTALDKKVSWDGNNKRVVIEDNAVPVDNTTVVALNQQINNLTQQLATAKAEVTSKDATIAQLEKDKAALQEQVNKNNSNNNNNNSSSTSLRDLEDDLNDDYGDYERTYAEISLKGNDRNVTVNIDVDKDRWNDLSSSKQKSFLQDIADDIRSEYRNANISGTIYDDSNSNKLLTFETNSRGTVTTKTTTSTVSLSTLARDIRSFMNGYRSVTVTEVTLSGNSRRVEALVYVDKTSYERLGSSEKRSFTDALIDEVKSEYTTEEVYGTVYNTDNRNDRLDTF
ncbi:stalk domain-containing protein [Paenibacillus massiliensis]|uniref:stalk domain-containing protein n=1 Tax=Paenibacillus massiliensis TaxID=225917 RepID=UPI000404C1D4|nr:stalk domain-containing protein [Paenibacillus massiliensis]